MVAQQLTPELTQPNVLVEIDRGPAMGLSQGYERHSQEPSRAEILGYVSPAEEALISISSCRRAEPETIASGLCPEPGFGNIASTSTSTGNTGMIMRVQEGGVVALHEEFPTPGRISWSPDGGFGTTARYGAQETASVGMGYVQFVGDNNQQDYDPYFTGERSGNACTRPEAARQRALFESAHPDVPPLLGRVTAAVEDLRTMGCLDCDSRTRINLPLGHLISLFNPSDQEKALSCEYALEDRCYDNEDNLNTGLVTGEKSVSEADTSSLFSKPKDPSHCSRSLEETLTGRSKESQQTHRGVAGALGLPVAMSWAAGSKTHCIIDCASISRGTLMWMIEHNLRAELHQNPSGLAGNAPALRTPKLGRIQLKSEPKPLPSNTPSTEPRAQKGPDRMENCTGFAPYEMALDDIHPSEIEIEDILRQIQWEQSIDEQIFAVPDYNTTHFGPSLSPPSTCGYASPSSMTTGGTNQSPPVPLLDYDMSFPAAASAEDPECLFPELMGYPINMNPDWVGSTPAGYSDLFLTLDNAQVKASSPHPTDSQLYPAAAPDTTIYNSNPAFEPHPTTQPPPATAQTEQTMPSSTSSSSQKTTTTSSTGLTCPYCGATLADKTKLKVHTNKHTKPFRCAAAGCGYATAEKKSLRRHLQAKSRWDEGHRAAAQSGGVSQVRHRCPRPGCTYATARDDNLKRHINTCAQ